MPHRSAAVLPSDEDLACRAQLGCAASFEELLRRFQMPVLHFLRHRGAGDDAEDLLQDTFIRAYTKLDQYRPQWRFATWVFTIARRVSINHYRRGRRVSGGESLGSVESNSPDPAVAAVVEEDRKHLWAVAEKLLSEEELTTMWLHYVEDMPAREIGVVVGRSRVAIKTMLFRARKKLLPCLRRMEIGGVMSEGPDSAQPESPSRGAANPNDREPFHKGKRPGGANWEVSSGNSNWMAALPPCDGGGHHD